MTTNAVLVLVGLVIFSCGVKERPDEISGVYVREFSFEVVNAESGAKVGMRTVRDSIFIEPMDDGFEVSNRKWRKNDYDLEGWQSMEHADDRPISAFVSTLSSNALSSGDRSFALYFDSENERLYREKGGDIFYSKVR